MSAATRLKVGAGFSLAVAFVVYGACCARDETSLAPEQEASESAPPDGVNKDLYEEARVEFFTAYGRLPSRLDALSYAAELAQSRKDYENAVACFQQIPSEDPRYGHLARYQQGFSLLKLNRATEAEPQLRKFLKLESQNQKSTPRHHQDAMQRLRFILEVELRFEERHELLKEMHERKLSEPFEIITYCFPTLLRWNGPQAVAWCEEFWKNDPDDPLLCAALARYRVGQGRFDEAQELLESIPADGRTHPLVTAAWLYLHSQAGDWNKMDEIVRGLPPPKEGDPWLLLGMRGLLQNRLGRFEEAARCYRLVLEADPANAEACQGLSQAMSGMKQLDERKVLVQKADVLGRIQNRLGWVENEEGARIPLAEIADLCRQIGLEQQARLVDDLIANADSPRESERDSPGERKP